MRTAEGATSTSMVDLVGVVIPCFNDGAYLREALESLGPERARGEGMVIVNDGSTDPATLDVLAGLRMRGFRVIDQPNQGLASARNTGWQACAQPYILFLDADNRVDPSYPVKAAAILDQEPATAVVYSDKLLFGLREGLVEQPVVTLPQLLVGNRIDACAVVRRSVLATCGGADEGMRDGYEDWELWIRLMAQGHRFHRIPEPLFHYRVREGSLLSRVDHPEIRAEVVGHVVRKHSGLFLEHARGVVSELHAIQAHDGLLVREAERVAAEARASAADALRSVRTLGDDLIALRAERDTHASDASALRSELQAQQERHAEATRMLQGELSVVTKRNARTEQALHELQQQKDALAAEAHRLVGEVDRAMRALDTHREHARALQGLIGQYEERIRALEASKLWRLRKAWYKMWALLRTGSDRSRRSFTWARRIAFLVSAKGRTIVRRFLAKVFRALYLWTEIRPVRILVGDEQLQAAGPLPGDTYSQWLAHHRARPSDLANYKEDVALFAYRPRISVVMPVYNPPVELLDAAIRSVVQQVYGDVELCIADDRSTDPEVRKCLERWMKDDARVRVVFRKENGHISRATNSALELATGEFTALMDHDDLLAPDALHHVVKRLNIDRTLDILYTDEDKVDEQGHHSDPHFKPQWCPDHLLSRNYFGHLVVVRTALLREVGGCRPGFEGSQDYDLLLRLTERSERIAHIPRVLYHWRIHAASAAKGEDVKPYAYDAAKRALTEALTRRGEPADVSFLEGFRGYGIRFTSPLRGRVSIIIPTKDKSEVLGTCLRSVFALTDHPDFEVIVVSNNSSERALFDLMESMAREHGDRFRWFRMDEPFNFSRLMNAGVKAATGQHILFLNNDTEVIHADWLRAMHEWSQRPRTGAVGVKLLYHNDTIQHGGVVIGLGGVAGHVFTHTHKDGPGYFNYVNTVNNYSAVTAACMMVERAKLDVIGGWDEAFTVEYNDVDLCLRLREAGLHNVYLPHVSLYHYESLTRGHPHMTREGYERHVREVNLFKERWPGYIQDDPCYNPHLTRGAHDFRLA